MLSSFGRELFLCIWTLTHCLTVHMLTLGGLNMRLLTAKAIKDCDLEEWKKDALYTFEEKMENTEKPFPCIPATQGHALDHFRYGFVAELRKESSANNLAQLLTEYSQVYRTIGNYTSLIVFYETSSQLLSVKQYEQEFWGQLNNITEMDLKDWPSHIPVDPHDSLWEFCFHGEQYFMFCGTPAHQNRQSRYFPYFMLAITPRLVLENFHSSPIHANKIKSKIRKRLKNYDSIPIHPDLNTYGKQDNYEWKQYFLHDDDTTLSKCPFHRFINKFKK